MSSRCPSELALEEHLARQGAPVDAHLAGCASCQARLLQMRQEGDHFRQFVYPRTLDAVLERSERKRGWRWIWLVAAPALAAAAAVALVVRPGAPAEDYLGTKGGALGFAVFAGGAKGVRAVDDGAQVPAAAALRFRVHPSAACHLWIASLDAAGQISRIYPAEGEGGALVSGTAALPGGAVLDGRQGPERFYAVCTRRPLPFSALEKSVRGAAPGVRTAKTLQGLPEDATQSSVLVEKTP